MFWGRRADGILRISQELCFFQPFMEEISWLYRLIYQNIYWEQRYDEIKQVMCRQLDEQRLFLRECRVNMQKGEEICGRKKMALKTLFSEKEFIL